MNEDFLKIIGILLISAAACVMIRIYRPDFALTVSIACAVTVLLLLFNTLLPAINSLKGLITKIKPAATYFGIALKALGIAYISGFAADVCRDFGQSSLASKAEFAGKCAIFILSLPLIKSILDVVTGFAGL